ncbi:BglG family transcription antiterminator [Hafnia alvei]|uniref:Ascorbate-specific PTS system EIIA component n=1 Tax=Hafnia alvei TaxID=569 RepID=A0A1C6YYB4_HAFAL|nr:BglG family transcription antiterminator [Hafnia alvei]NLS52671.1 PRD domain-containing protein [Hafnia alvei]SCM51836.1 Transcriptional antiterminator [Hafnia alvei]
MAVDKRVFTVLDAIVSDPSITGVALESEFNLTRKQLSYTIKKINDYLESHHVETITRLKTGKLHVPKHVIEKFRHQEDVVFNNRYLFAEEERGELIIFFLLTRAERLSLLHLTSALNVSQNTIINDIKKIKSSVSQYNLKIHYNREQGYHVEGEEIKKRYLLLSTLRKILILPVSKNIIAQYNNVISEYIEQVGNTFSEIEKCLKIQFTDQQLQELIYFICFIQHRIKLGKTVELLPDTYSEITHGRDFKLMQNIIHKMGVNQYNEHIFLTAIIQSSNIQTISDKYFHLDTLLLESVVVVVDNFEKISCITIKEKSELIEKIYQHWKPAYYRIRYHLTNTNSVYDLVAKEFNHLHEMVRRAVLPFEKILHCEVPNEEVAFLTVLFGGWLTREGLINNIKMQKTAIVVSENSATVSTYLYLTLQVLLPELHFIEMMSRREFEKYSRHYDVVFSTTFIKTDKILFVVDPAINSFHKSTFRHQVISSLQGVDPHIIQVEELLLILEKYGTIHDKKGLQKELTSYIYDESSSECQPHSLTSETPSLSELLCDEHLCFQDTNTLSWEQSIAKTASPLLTQNLLEPRYITTMLNKISIEQPYIMLAEGLIIAHAGVDDGVNKTCMSLLRLPEKISIAGYMQADIIIVLATNNPQKHLKALAQLNEFLEFNEGGEKIRSSINKEALLQHLSVYS